MNEFKFSTLRQFGSENVSFTASIHSEKTVLSEKEITEQINQIDKVIAQAFVKCNEREISEKDILADFSDRRKEAVAKLDKALKQEIAVKEDAQKTADKAIKLSK